MQNAKCKMQNAKQRQAHVARSYAKCKNLGSNQASLVEHPDRGPSLSSG